MSNFIPYGIKVANTKTKERVIIELEFGGSEQLYQYLAPLVHDWAGGIEMKPLTTKKEVNETISEAVLESIDNRLKAIETLVWYQLFNQVNGK